MKTLTIKPSETVAEFFDTIVELQLKSDYKMLCENIKQPPAIGMWSHDPQEDIKIAKEYRKALLKVMDYYGIKP